MHLDDKSCFELFASFHTSCKGPKGNTVFIQDTKKIDEQTDLEQERGLR